MSMSFTVTETKTFTLTHAKYLASKVATDLKRLQRLYGHLTDKEIQDYEGEITELLRQGYLETVTYGFQRDGKWIEPTLKYTASELANGAVDDDPGRIKPGIDITGATLCSYLTYSGAWSKLTEDERASAKKQLSVQRTNGSQPLVNGYFVDDKTYASGGRSLGRATVRGY